MDKPQKASSTYLKEVKQSQLKIFSIYSKPTNPSGKDPSCPEVVNYN